jgi:hypothetical protein
MSEIRTTKDADVIVPYGNASYIWSYVLRCFLKNLKANKSLYNKGGGGGGQGDNSSPYVNSMLWDGASKEGVEIEG